MKIPDFLLGLGAGKRAQVSVEYLVVIAVVMVAVGIAFAYSTISVGQTSALGSTSNAVRSIASAVDTVHARGPGTTARVDIELPYSIAGSILQANELGYKLQVSGSTATTDIWAATKAQLVGALPEEPGLHTIIVEAKDDGTVRIGKADETGRMMALILTPSSVNETVDPRTQLEIDFVLINWSGENLSNVGYALSGSLAQYASVQDLDSSLQNGQSDGFEVLVNIDANSGTFYADLMITNDQNIEEHASIAVRINQQLDTNNLYITTYEDANFNVIKNSFEQGSVVYYKVDTGGSVTVSDMNVTIADPFNQSITSYNKVAVSGLHYGSYVLDAAANTGTWNISAVTQEKGYATGSTSFSVVASQAIPRGDANQGTTGAGTITPGYPSGNDTWLISRNADFSTVDTNYSLYDNIYVKVVTDNFSGNPIPSNPQSDPYEFFIKLNNGTESIQGHISGSGDNNTYTGFLTFSDSDWNNQVATVEVKINAYGAAFYGAQTINIGKPIDQINFYSNSGYTQQIPNYEVYPGQVVYLEIITAALNDQPPKTQGSDRYVIQTIDSLGNATTQGALSESIARTGTNTYRGQFTVPNYYAAPDWYVLHVYMRAQTGTGTYEIRKAFHVNQNSGSQFQKFTVSPYQLSTGQQLGMNFEYKSTNSGVATHYAIALSADQLPDAMDYWIVGSADAQLHNLIAGINGGITNGVWTQATESRSMPSAVPNAYYYVILVVGDNNVSTPNNWSNYNRSPPRVRVGENTAPNINNIAYMPLVPTAGDSITISATADDSSTGNSNITLCEVRIDSGTWQRMRAVDTAYNSSVERVELNIGVFAAGSHTFVMRCSDSGGNTKTSAAQPLSVVSASGIVISEVFFNYGSSAAEQWVEVYNPTASSVNLSGYALSDLDESFTLPSASLPAHYSILIARDSAAFTAKYGFAPDVSGMGLAMNRTTGDYIRLKNASGITLDFVAFNSPAGYAEWSITADANKTARREPIANDTNAPSDWVSNSVAQPSGLGG